MEWEDGGYDRLMNARQPPNPNQDTFKFFVNGACLKGENCEFSHDRKDALNNICTYYQKGICSYGSRCRYAHVKFSRAESASSSSAIPYNNPISAPAAHAALPASYGGSSVTYSPGELSASSKPYFPPTKPVRNNSESRKNSFSENGVATEPRYVKPEDLSMCSFAAAGHCPRGDECPHIHGNLCPTCGKHCLHPLRPLEREEHLKTCKKKQKHLEALKQSQEIECSVCLEQVLSKATASERKFGLLAECDHPFCISCIKNWRSSSLNSGMDMNNASRTCPVCRKLSYFVVPSVIWYSSKEEKQEIIDNYKKKLRSIDCKHFDFGNGNCPFGTSCFYKHTVRPGSYTWKYNRPPPRRPRRQRSTVVSNVDAIFDVEHLIDDDELDIFDADDYFEDDYEDYDDYTVEDYVDEDYLEFMLMQLNMGCDFSSDDENCFL